MAQESESPHERVLPQTDCRATTMFLASSIPTSPPSLVSQEICMMVDAIYPQGCHIIISKSSIPQPLASTSTAAAAFLLLESALLDPPPRELDQPTIETLANYGIKVRDFAYESTLPPIAPIRRLPRQVQPGPRPLKRVRNDYEEPEDDPFSQHTPPKVGTREGDPTKKMKLERKLTEPAAPAPNPPTRARGFTDLNSYEASQDTQFTAGANSQQSDYSSPSQSQPPLQYFESQDSEPYIHTPLVTPNGSLQWPVTDTSTMPASQLDTNSQAIVPELISYSQLGFSQVDEPSQEATSAMSSPLSEPPSSQPLIPRAASPGPSTLPSIRLSPLPSPPSRSPQSPNPSPNSIPHPTVSPNRPPRYHLRNRSAVTSPPHTPTRPHSRTRAHPHPPSPRPLAFSMQSAHSRSKSRNATGSPRSRTVRKGTANGREESMIVG